MKKLTERKIKSVQKYTFEIVHYEDGYSVMNRTNEGFSVLELLGVSSMLTNQIIKVTEDAVKPTDEININSTNSPFIHKKIKQQ